MNLIDNQTSEISDRLPGLSLLSHLVYPACFRPVNMSQSLVQRAAGSGWRGRPNVQLDLLLFRGLGVGLGR